MESLNSNFYIYYAEVGKIQEDKKNFVEKTSKLEDFQIKSSPLKCLYFSNVRLRFKLRKEMRHLQVVKAFVYRSENSMLKFSLLILVSLPSWKH